MVRACVRRYFWGRRCASQVSACGGNDPNSGGSPSKPAALSASATGSAGTEQPPAPTSAAPAPPQPVPSAARGLGRLAGRPRWNDFPVRRLPGRRPCRGTARAGRAVVRGPPVGARRVVQAARSRLTPPGRPTASRRPDLQGSGGPAGLCRRREPALAIRPGVELNGARSLQWRRAWCRRCRLHRVLPLRCTEPARPHGMSGS